MTAIGHFDGQKASVFRCRSQWMWENGFFVTCGGLSSADLATFAHYAVMIHLYYTFLPHSITSFDRMEQLFHVVSECFRSALRSGPFRPLSSHFRLHFFRFFAVFTWFGCLVDVSSIFVVFHGAACASIAGPCSQTV